MFLQVQKHLASIFNQFKDVYLRSNFDESQEVKGNVRDVLYFFCSCNFTIVHCLYQFY